ncbi:MAG: FAD:protein FMN transferase [Eubacteriales bacterium]|nr:FAD:protein FMN transferase [Eubacteriales bacterium]MDD4583902.1 FAD:protein FMN transferase [Eubacteriales bacterium]
MIKKSVIVCLVLFLSLCLTTCGSPEKERYEAQFLVLFDTVTQIVSYMDSKEDFTDYAQQIHDYLEDYHQLYDIYNDYEGINNIKTINDNAGKEAVKVDQRIIDLLLFAKDVHNKTDGKVNVALGSVLEIWHDYRTKGIEDPKNAILPSMEELKAAVVHTDINNVIIDETESTVFISDPDLRLDVGAIAKGYAVEQVSQIAINNGFTSGLISVGGNVRIIGKKGKEGQLWNVGIQNPNGQYEPYLHVAHLTNSSLVTSGNYIRYYTVDEKKYHHIIDPETLFPADYFTAVTIICQDSGIADALSTAVYNMPYEEGLELIENLPDTEAIWIFPNGEEKYSSHFAELIKE